MPGARTAAARSFALTPGPPSARSRNFVGEPERRDRGGPAGRRSCDTPWRARRLSACRGLVCLRNPEAASDSTRGRQGRVESGGPALEEFAGDVPVYSG